MTDQELREKLYKPYCEAWKILRLIQYAQHRGTDEMWDKFFDELKRLEHAYPGNRYVRSLCITMAEAGEYIVAENSKTETKERE